MENVIVDTSSILFGMAAKKDVFSIAAKRFHKPVLISRGVLNELLGISKNKGRRGASARAALALIRVKNVKVHRDKGSVDSWIAGSAAKHNNTVVITNDTALFRKVRSVNRNVFKLSRSGTLRG